MASSTLPAAPLDVADTAVTGGVDTHLDVHVAAALDRIGGLFGTASFPTTPDGYEQLLRWLRGFGTVVQVGVEGTSSYGAGLTRTLQASGVLVVEVDRPNRQKRRRVGKSDTLDAVAAARAAMAGEALGLPKSKSGNVEGIRLLGVARQSSIKARTQAMNQLRSLVSTGPRRAPRAPARAAHHPAGQDLRGLAAGHRQHGGHDDQGGAADLGQARAVPR